MAARPCITVRSTTVGATAMFCPTCGGDRAAEVREGRRWLRFGRLALVPLRRSGRHLTCTACGTTHEVDVLDRLTTAELAHRLLTVTHQLTVMTVRAGDPADRDLRRRAVQHIRTVVPAYDQNRLDRELLELDPAQAPALVAPLAAELEVEGKERLVADVVRVALAAHTITPHQRWLIDAAGTALGLTPLHLTGIVSGIAASVEPREDLR